MNGSVLLLVVPVVVVVLAVVAAVLVGLVAALTALAAHVCPLYPWHCELLCASADPGAIKAIPVTSVAILFIVLSETLR